MCTLHRKNGVDYWGWSGYRKGQELFSSPNSLVRLWRSHSLLFNGHRVSWLRIKRPRTEADHSTLLSAQVKNVWSYTSIPSVCLHGINRNNFSFYPYYYGLLLHFFEELTMSKTVFSVLHLSVTYNLKPSTVELFCTFWHKNSILYIILGIFIIRLHIKLHIPRPNK